MLQAASPCDPLFDVIPPHLPPHLATQLSRNESVFNIISESAEARPSRSLGACLLPAFANRAQLYWYGLDFPINPAIGGSAEYWAPDGNPQGLRCSDGWRRRCLSGWNRRSTDLSSGPWAAAGDIRALMRRRGRWKHDRPGSFKAAQRPTDSGDHAWCNTNRDTNRTTWLSRGEIHRRGQPAGVPSVSKGELRRRSSLTQRRKTAGKTKVLQDVSTRFPVGDERHHPHSRVASDNPALLA